LLISFYSMNLNLYEGIDYLPFLWIIWLGNLVRTNNLKHSIQIIYTKVSIHRWLWPLRQQNIIFPIICYSPCGNKILFSLLYAIALAATKYYFPYYIPIICYSPCGNKISFSLLYVIALAATKYYFPYYML
jgi:hypothetical protein